MASTSRRRDADADVQPAPPVVTEDSGTTKLSGDEVANAAGKSLHGDRAQPEQHEQPDARLLPSGTLIAEPSAGDDA